MVKDGHRASDIIGGIRAIFRKGDQGKAAARCKRTHSGDLRLVRGDLQSGRVSVRTELFSSCLMSWPTESNCNWYSEI